MAPVQRVKSFSRPFDGYRRSIDKNLPPKPPAEMATILIGPKQHSFKVNKKLLCAASPFFREKLEGSSHSRPVSLWLPGESATMFALFVEWLHSRSTFRWYLDDAVNAAQETTRQAVQDIHWTIIRLHLFASHLDLYPLQDLAMDALQDLYLKCDWDVTPTIINYIYTKCEALPAVRLRRWAVAMVAFSLTGGSHMSPHLPHTHSEADTDPDAGDAQAEDEDLPKDPPRRFHALLHALPEFAIDYAMHVRKMHASGLDLRFKNPQLRIPANRLRNEERAFGFRQCSFHSHRATVGERRCPHDASRGGRARKRDEDSMIFELESPVQEDSLAGLSAPRRKAEEAVPPPLFAELEAEKSLKHIRSVSSTLK